MNGRQMSVAMLFAVLGPVAAHAQAAPRKPASDTGFAAMQQRGKQAMGVDQYTSTHHFNPLPDGGVIQLVRDVDDTAGVAMIRKHIRDIARSFASGDFATPEFVHMQTVPGTKTMADKKTAINYTPRDIPRGAELRITTKDPEALKAVHEFLAFQQHEHHAM